jgi:alkylation response protein AidB-like acyl-CoA dehydrogenase
MDFSAHDPLGEYRSTAADWVAARIRPEWLDHARHYEHNFDADMYAELARSGILAAGWPAAYGGSDVDPDFAAAVLDDIEARGLRNFAWANTRIVSKTILEMGTEEQKRQYLPAALRGECRFSLGFTEPGAGSDAAAARTRAVRTGSGWRINGAKMFTSTARISTHVFLLTRTSTDVPKHKGLTFFVVPLNADGVEIRPVPTLDHPSNATYYTDVDVPDSARLGEVGSGWSVMRVALVFERSGGFRQVGATVAERVAQWARDQDLNGEPVTDSPVVRHRLARIAIEDEVARLLQMQVNWVAQQGGAPGVEGSMAKLFTTEHNQAAFAELMDLMGPSALLKQGAAHAPLGGLVEHDFRAGIVTTIYGGASEILRDIVAERRLGLPRSRPVD